ncbi:MAG: hypothetical protein ACRDQY_26710 [Pseudonocardiaceae bacterium]
MDRTGERLQATAGSQIDELREQVATLRQDATDLAAAWTELAAQLAAEQDQVRQQRRRAEVAEQQLIRAAGHLEYLTTELTTAREQVEHWQAQAAEHRAELANGKPEPTAVKTERNHSAQQLTGQQTRGRTSGQRPKLGPRQVMLARQMLRRAR